MNLKFFRLYIDSCIKTINKNFDKLSREEKGQLLNVANALMDCITSNMIIEDYYDKKN